MRGMEPNLPELEWDSAVLALSQNGMDVADTPYAVQTEWLQPLYEYVYSEYTGVTKTDMEEIKKIIMNEAQYSLEVWMWVWFRGSDWVFLWDGHGIMTYNTVLMI